MPFPFDAADIAAVARLSSFYNGNAYDASTNAGGMAVGGHRVNFVPSLQDVARVANAVSSAADYSGTQATNAAASAVTAASQAASLQGTSTTSVLIGTGAKSFTTQASKQWPVGAHLKIWSAANPANYMTGPVASYSGTALGVTVEAIGGSGTFTDWVIEISGTPGAAGATGATGAQGLSPALGWNFATATDDSDPGSGNFKFNNSDVTLATFIYFDNNERNGNSVTAWLDALDDSTNTAHLGTLFLGQVSNPAIFAEVRVSGTVTDGTGYRKVPVVYVSGPGGFTSASHVAVRQNRTGNKGVDGAGAGNMIFSGTATDNRPVVCDGSGGTAFKQLATPLATVATSGSHNDLTTVHAPVQTHGSDIPAAATLNLGASTGDLVDVTGNTGITAITLADGREMTVRFTGTPIITHGASLVLPGAANMTMAAGDVAVFRGYAAGVVRMVTHQRASIEIQAALALKAPLASPTFTGTPAAPTAAVGTSTTQLASTAFVATATGLRRFLTGATIIYVRSDATGDTGRDGSANTTTSAFLTWQAAWNFFNAGYYLNGQSLTFQAGGSGARTFTVAAARLLEIIDTSSCPPGSGKIEWIGDIATPSNVILTNVAAGLPCIDIGFVSHCNFSFSGFDVRSGADGFKTYGSGRLYVGNLKFGGALTSVALRVLNPTTQLIFSGNINIANTGTMGTFIEANQGRVAMESAGTVTLTGTPAVSLLFNISNGGLIFADTTFTGNFTGKRWSATSGGRLLHVSGTGAIPSGTIAGTESGYGSYVDLTTPGNSRFGNTGVTDASNAVAGLIGECIESEILVGSAVALTTAVVANITSISLTPGDWDVWATIAYDAAGTTVQSSMAAAINTVSATFPTYPGKGAALQFFGTLSTGNDNIVPVGQRRISVSTTTTVYLVGFATFTTSTLAGFGYLGARRRR